jgi:hypothetical protein
LTRKFLIRSYGEFDLCYAPFEYVKYGASVVIVGITPGWSQMRESFEIAQRQLASGADYESVLREVDRDVKFSGGIRRRLVSWPYELGLPELMQIPTCDVFFGARSELAHTTSVIRYALFFKRERYSGYKPVRLRDLPFLEESSSSLRSELQANANAIVVPMGSAVSEVLELYIANGTISREQVRLGFPHASMGGGANERQLRFQSKRGRWAAQTRDWFRRTPGATQVH